MGLEEETRSERRFKLTQEGRTLLMLSQRGESRSGRDKDDEGWEMEKCTRLEGDRLKRERQTDIDLIFSESLKVDKDW